jgi:hypothetical protein
MHIEIPLYVLKKIIWTINDTSTLLCEIYYMFINNGNVSINLRIT